VLKNTRYTPLWRWQQ